MATRSGPSRKPTNKPSRLNPKLPLAHIPKELFAQAVANGVPVDQAYRQAGYKGGDHSRRALRNCLDIDERIKFLVGKRIEDDARNRAKKAGRLPALRDRVTRELERIAFSDLRDLVQWDRKPVYDDQGNVVEIAEELRVTPSRMISADAAANIMTVRKFGKGVQVETHSKMAALDKLAKMLGLYQDAGPASIVNNATQINIGTAPTAQDNALEAARRLAFAIAKAQQMQALAGPVTIEHAPDAERKE